MTGLYTTTQTSTALRVRFRLFSFVLPSLPQPLRLGWGKPPDPHRSGKEVNRALCHLPSRKIKTAGALAASANHMTRAVPTPNADPRRAQMNRVFIGSDDPAADAAALIPALDAVDDAGKKRRRSNSVIAIEVLLTASPEWWADASAEQQQDWLDRSTAWLVQEYGRENIAHLRLHGDERTPHLTGYVVPLDPDTGHLNARRWIEARPAADSSRPTTPPPWRLWPISRDRGQHSHARAGASPLRPDLRARGYA